MKMMLREYDSHDAAAVSEIWNQVIADGNAFPQLNQLEDEDADRFFRAQTYTGVAVDTEKDEVVGMYILHPNNEGRCGHICNASYAVRKDIRGEHVGEMLVKDCLNKAHEKGFRILQFNAVVASNIHAIHLLGFRRIGMVPAGFRMPDGSYEDIILYYHNV